MKTALKVFGIASIVMASLAIIGSLDMVEGGSTFVGGAYLLAHGIISVIAVKKMN